MPTDYIPNGYQTLPNALSFGESLDRLISFLPDGRVVFVANSTTTPIEAIIWAADGTVSIPGLTATVLSYTLATLPATHSVGALAWVTDGPPVGLYFDNGTTWAPVSTQALKVYTVATLPTAGTLGRLAYVSNGNPIGVYVDNGTSWVSLFTNEVLPSYAFASLPAAASAGRLARVTDNIGGVWMDGGTGNAWRPLNAEVIDLTQPPFNAKGDDATDNAAAFTAALAAGKTFYLPPGIYRTSVGISLTGQQLFGVAGSTFTSSHTVIKPTNAVAIAITLGALSELSGIAIDGTLTTGKTGILIGESSPTPGAAVFSINRVVIQNFDGAGGYGAHLNTGTYGLVKQLYISGCDIGLLVDGLNTTTLFESSAFRTSTHSGVLVKNGNSITFLNCVFEGNTEEGFKIAPGASGTAVAIRVIKSWFELNWLNNSPNTNYDFYADGTGSPTPTVTTTLKDNYFLTNSTAFRLSIKLDGAGVASFLLDNNLVPNKTAGILVSNNAFGKITNFPAQIESSYSTIVSDANNLASNAGHELTANVETAWTDYVPTYSSSVGNAAATFTGPGTVTTNKARWKKMGKTLFITVNFSATLNAVTPTWLAASLPLGLSAQSNSQAMAGGIKDNNINAIGRVNTSGSTLQFFKPNLTDTFTSGTAVGGNITTTIEVA